MQENKFRKQLFAALALAGASFWFVVQQVPLGTGAISSGSFGLSGWMVVATTFLLLFLVIDRLSRGNARSIIRKNWELAGEKVALTDRLARVEEHSYETLRSIAVAVDGNEDGANGHAGRVACYAVRIGRELGLVGRELKSLEEAAQLHDLGKIWIPDYLFLKHKLSEKERELVRQHPAMAAEALASIHAPQEVISAVLHHHENFDGTGYPAGLNGASIPLEARIIAVADAFDHGRSSFALDDWRGLQNAVDAITIGSGRRFEPQVVNAFLSALDDLVNVGSLDGLATRVHGARTCNVVGNC
jgi:HD-GYP domain-containing protein (c-di-GMP phosphodiesterase class II)